MKTTRVRKVVYIRNVRIFTDGCINQVCLSRPQVMDNHITHRRRKVFVNIIGSNHS